MDNVNRGKFVGWWVIITRYLFLGWGIDFENLEKWEGDGNDYVGRYKTHHLPISWLAGLLKKIATRLPHAPTHTAPTNLTNATLSYNKNHA